MRIVWCNQSVTKYENMLKILTVLSIMFTSLTFAQQVGIASFYGADHHGKLMANGKRFNMNALTCASNSHKFGTKLRVTNKENNKSVIVTVTDTGSFGRKYGRIIDLSRAAFASIADLKRGLVKVIVETVD